VTSPPPGWVASFLYFQRDSGGSSPAISLILQLVRSSLVFSMTYGVIGSLLPSLRDIPWTLYFRIAILGIIVRQVSCPFNLFGMCWLQDFWVAWGLDKVFGGRGIRSASRSRVIRCGLRPSRMGLRQQGAPSFDGGLLRGLKPPASYLEVRSTSLLFLIISMQ